MKPAGFRPCGLLASTAALAEFDQMWEVMWPEEKARIINLLVHRMECRNRQDDMHVAQLLAEGRPASTSG